MSFSLDFVNLLILVFFRIAALLLALPFFNTNYLPANVKLLLILAISFFVAQFVPIKYNVQDLTLFAFVLMLLKEIVLGFAIGLLVNIFIAAFSYAAEIISFFMGFTIMNVFDPTFGQVSILSRLFILLFYLLFFVTDAYHFFLTSIVQSFSWFPVMQTDIPQGFFAYILDKSALIFLLAFKLAFPFALIVYLINLALALVNRLIPQINVFIVGLPLQVFVGIASLMVGASVLIYTGADFVEALAKKYLFFMQHLG